MSNIKTIPPKFLKPGDCVSIVAPARKISEEELLPSIKTLESWGLKVKLGKHIYASSHQFAGKDELRQQDFQTMLDDNEVRAIFSARGGYGALRIIDNLDLALFKKHPKWIVGYSDVTVFHSHIHTHTGIETLHATMPINFGKDAESLELLRKALFGEPLNYSLPSHSLNRNGESSGVLVGGNLSLLYALASTPSDIDTGGKILFLEDLDEYLYHIDRMMMQLKRGGKLAKLKGLIIGSFSEMKDNTVPFGKTAEEIILDAVKEYDFPVCFNFPAGHSNKNYPLFIGITASLSVKQEVSLKFS
ncbi:MAG TPA: LD-carboxypeptidase [Bacteroidia bacterium]|jgi:muramoyltetrapeptide carboxypeptidase|nr:LD-carboxypeptidase [Bacteroidia bacterium]